MDSKEATSHQLQAKTSSGYSSLPSDNDEKNLSLNDLAQVNRSRSINNNKDSVSDDEGYVSGEEEFVVAPDNPDLVGNSDGPFVETVESLPNGVVMNDDGVVKGDVLVKDEVGFDGNNEIINSVEKLDVNSAGLGGGVVGGNVENSPVEEVETKEEVMAVESSELDNVDLKLTDEGDSVVDTIEADVAGPGVVVVGEINGNKDTMNNREAEDVELEKVEELGPADVKLTEEGDSIVDTIRVDSVAPGVAVVGEVEENEGVASPGVVVGEMNENENVQSNQEKKDVGEVPDVELEKFEEFVPHDVKLTAAGESIVDAVQVNSVAPGVAVVGEVEEYEGEKLGSEVSIDSIGGTDESNDGSVQVNVAGPGVVVGEINENENVQNNEEGEDVGGVAVVEQEKPEGFYPCDVKLTAEGDCVVDTIQVDSVAPGVAVVGEVEENKSEKVGQEVSIDSVLGTDESNYDNNQVGVGEINENDVMQNNLVKEDGGGVADVEPDVEPEKLEEFGTNDVKLTAGDSIVDTIQVDSVAPGVAVVGEVEQNEGDKLAREVSMEESVGNLEVQSAKPSVEDTSEIPELNSLPEFQVARDEESEAVAVIDSANGVHTRVDSADYFDVDRSMKKPEAEHEPTLANEAFENGTKSNNVTDVDKSVELQSNGEHSGEEANPEEDSLSDADDLVFGSEAAKKFIEDLERESGVDSHTSAGDSIEQSRIMDGQIVTDSEEEGEETDDDEGDGKELFDSAALAALLKAATGADSDGSGSITITSQDGSRLFSVERPAGLGSSLQALRPASRSTRPTLFSPSALSGGGESEDNLSDDEKKKLEKLQSLRVKFLRLVHRLGLSPEGSVASQVLYRLALLGGRRNTQSFNLDAAKQTASQLESEEGNDLDFSVNILVIGKSGVGKSATINSMFGDEKASIDAFETGTASAKELSGFINGVNVHVVDTPGLKSSVMEQGFNRSVLSSVQKVTKKCPIDVALYVDRLDAQTRDLNDLPLLKTVTSSLGPSIWRNAIVALTHAASAPPDGPSGTPLSYEVFVSQRSHVVQQSIGQAIGDLRMMSPNNPVSLIENHRDCRKNREGEKVLPNGQSWRPQLLLLCYAMKILSEASLLSKPQDPFDHRKLFGYGARSPPLPYMLSSMLQSRAHPKLPDQGGDSVDSDVDLDDFSDSDQEEEDEYDQLPPFKPLKLAQLSKLSKEQKKAYFEEYDYRVKLLQKKQWTEELKRMREIKKRGKNAVTDYDFNEGDPDSGAAAPVAVPLPDMALPPSFDGDNPAYRYRFLEPTSQFLARPVLDSHGWDHDCGYDGVNLEHSLAIMNKFPVAYTFQVTKDKKDFTVSLDSSISAKHGEKMSTMAGFDIQSMGKQLAYVFRGETKFKNLKKNKAAAGVTFTLLGENVIPGVKIEDQITLGKRYVLVGSAGAVKSQQETAYGANFELQRRDDDYPIGQVQSTVSMSLVKWRGDLALGFNGLAQLSIGRNSKVAVRAGINNKMSGQVTVRTSSSDHLSLALAAVVPTLLSIYNKLRPASSDKYSMY